MGVPEQNMPRNRTWTADRMGNISPQNTLCGSCLPVPQHLLKDAQWIAPEGSEGKEQPAKSPSVCGAGTEVFLVLNQKPPEHVKKGCLVRGAKAVKQKPGQVLEPLLAGYACKRICQKEVAAMKGAGGFRQAAQGKPEGLPDAEIVKNGKCFLKRVDEAKDQFGTEGPFAGIARIAPGIEGIELISMFRINARLGIMVKKEGPAAVAFIKPGDSPLQGVMQAWMNQVVIMITKDKGYGSAAFEKGVQGGEKRGMGFHDQGNLPGIIPALGKDLKQIEDVSEKDQLGSGAPPPGTLIKDMPDKAGEGAVHEFHGLLKTRPCLAQFGHGVPQKKILKFISPPKMQVTDKYLHDKTSLFQNSHEEEISCSEASCILTFCGFYMVFLLHCF